ncbi:MAG: hypothetical protein WAO76_07545 [Georgfuchsia sp.]
MIRIARSLVSLGLLAAGCALADDQDVSALLLADTAPAAVESADNWKTYVEGAFGGSTRRDGNQTRHDHRLSLDVQYDNSFAPGWRAVFADRLDMNWPALANDENSINTVKEAYLSWQARPDAILDLGRINVRYGVAMGRNPTDYFRSGALRSIVSVDPASLKENRQGSVMLRGQSLWDGGSITALYSPKLSDQASSNAFNPDWGATNNQNRWLIAISQKISDDINPQFLVYQEEKLPVQLGLNLTALVSDATVIYFEWSGGRSPSLLTQALNQAALAASHDGQFRNRVSTGLTYTTSNKISLTAEFEFNGGGLDKADWKALGRGSPAIYGLFRNWLQNAQEPPTKQAVFFYGRWQDALINHLDLSAMEHFDAVDSSRLYWLEVRYHLERAEFAVQWQRNSGQLLSNYGAAPQEQIWQALLRYYF